MSNLFHHLLKEVLLKEVLVYSNFPNAHAEIYHVGDPHCPNVHAEIYFRAPGNIWRGSAQQSIEGHQKFKARRREKGVEVTESCFLSKKEWYAEPKNVLIKEDAKIWWKRGYN